MHHVPLVESSRPFNAVPLAPLTRDRKSDVCELLLALVISLCRRARDQGPRIEEEEEKDEKGARRGTLFIQEASAAAISHRLDSDRFEPLYAYRRRRQCPSESSLRSAWALGNPWRCSGRSSDSQVIVRRRTKALKETARIPAPASIVEIREPAKAILLPGR